MKNSNDTIGNRTRNLPSFSAVPQPTALPHAPTELLSDSYVFLPFFPVFTFCLLISMHDMYTSIYTHMY
jgi:hypothetical protein